MSQQTKNKNLKMMYVRYKLHFMQNNQVEKVKKKSSAMLKNKAIHVCVLRIG